MSKEYNFMEWYNYQASAEEKELANKASEYEYLFDDMIFRIDDYDFCVPEEIHYFDTSQLRFIVKELNDVYGYYEHTENEKIICIDTEQINNTPTILHEMIHAYEEHVSKYRYLHDVLYWNLYTDLRDKIPQLDELITKQANTSRQVDIIEKGGTHDILFFLKSLDLDIKMNYRIGTVFDYGTE